MKDYCKYADLFLGNGETDRFFEDGLASKWFYIKALCGNTTPHATLPFGKMSVGAYSGGYPTGYGTHYPNSCGGIEKLSENRLARGFSHLHQSGTGAIQYYYNYAIACPFYGEIGAASLMRELKNEYATPGYYSAELDGVFCEVTATKDTAYHRYTFEKVGGRVAVDFSNNGLSKIFGSSYYSIVKEPAIKLLSDSEAVFSGEFSGVKLYFYVKAEGCDLKASVYEDSREISSVSLIPSTLPYGVIFDFSGKEINLKVSYSTVSEERLAEGGFDLEFDEVKKNAYEIWNEALSRIRIEKGDEDFKKKFYSNLYHSLIKPADMTGESVLCASGDTVVDLATLWDQYKTLLPLIYMSYPEMGEKIARAIPNIGRSLGKIPCSFGLSNVFPCEEQAKMLGVLTLVDAYYMGIKGAEASVIEECIKRELSREDYKEFLESGYFERYTHILDVTDACLSVAEITEDEELKKRLITLSENWKKAYSEDGIMSEDSKYYEGDRYTYSFRLQKNMKERVEYFGGKEKFSKQLDDFFGFGKESVEQIRHIGAYKDISAKRYHRFEGFNNECDMETPYAYIYADKHDRLCEIIKECVDRSFGLGRGGLPGNNDSGGLSSLFIFNSLGIFPECGTGDFLIGTPSVDSAEIELTGGALLKIEVERKNKKEIYLDSVSLDGRTIEGYKISARELMGGGVLRFIMR